MLYFPDAGKNATRERFEKWKLDLMDCLKALNDKLVNNQANFLCGKTLTIGDIIVYCELSQFFEMCNLNVNHPDVSTHESLCKWFNRLAQDPAIAKHDKEFKAALSKLNKNAIN